MNCDGNCDGAVDKVYSYPELLGNPQYCISCAPTRTQAESDAMALLVMMVVGMGVIAIALVWIGVASL